MNSFELIYQHVAETRIRDVLCHAAAVALMSLNAGVVRPSQVDNLLVEAILQLCRSAVSSGMQCSSPNNERQLWSVNSDVPASETCINPLEELSESSLR